MNLTSLPVKYISDTAFLTAFFRAIESDRPDALFHDRYSQILGEGRGRELAQRIPSADSVASGCAVRTRVIDELIGKAIRKDEIDTVISLGAGLDTRAYRLSLPASLRWIEVDFPLVQAYKKNKLAQIEPTCILKSVSLDISDRIARQKFFQSIGTEIKRGFIITEGLLVYMSSEQVAALAMDIYEQGQIHWWLTDLSSPNGLQQVQKSLEQSQIADGVKLQFAPQEGSDFFGQYGWKEFEFCSLYEEALRFKRGRLPEAAIAELSQKDWEVFRRLSGIVLLTRA